MPEDLRESLRHSYMMSPVAALQALVDANSGGTLTEPWNPDVVAHFGGNIYEGMNCVQAWKVIPTNSVVAALDTIRTRVLNFALEIEVEAPEAGEAPANTSPVPKEKVEQIFNTYITGNVQNLANASPGAHQHATYNERDPELFRGLLKAIEEADVDVAIKRPALESVRAMSNASSPTSFREGYLQFMSAIADHMQVLGVVLAPFLPALASMLG
jgi:hypothetical protein